MALEFESLADFSLVPQILQAINLFTRLMNALIFFLYFMSTV